MITRGIIIGKLIDDLSVLQGQISLRCQVGLTDLNKYCEDFFKEVINITYNLDLKNLNEERINEPGLDLGDTRNKIAYQITSTNTSKKVSKTLSKITPKQLKEYSIFKVLILGNKQNSYDAIDKSLMTKCNFGISDIIDISDLCKHMVGIKYDSLYELQNLFEKEFQVVLTEIEIPNKEGNYPTTLYEKLEISPNSFSNNAKKFLKEYPGYPLKDIKSFYDKLGQLPRVTREFLEIVISLGNCWDGNYTVDFNELKRKLKIPSTELMEEISILEKRKFIYGPDDNYEPEVSTRFEELSVDIIEFAKNHNILKKIVVTMDFTYLDK